MEKVSETHRIGRPDGDQSNLNLNPENFDHRHYANLKPVDNESHYDTQLVIISHHRLQNDLLSDLFKSEAPNLDVVVLAKPEEFNDLFPASKESNPKLLVLVDYRGVEIKRTIELLRKYAKNCSEFQAALFNLPNNSKLEEFASWPQLSGAFLSSIDQTQLLKGIYAILNGEIWLPRKLVSKFVRKARLNYQPSDDLIDKLTEREIEILKVMSTGARNVEIAESLNLSPHTVKTHVYNIFKKINASNRLQAVNWANDHIG